MLAVTAIAALVVAWWQIGVSRELAALEAYEKYQLECLKYPEFTSGSVEFSNLSPEEQRRYESFVLYTLMMDERIYKLFPKDPGWSFSIKDDIRMHRNFLSSDYFAEQLEGQGWNFRPLITEVLSEPPAAEDKAKPTKVRA